jgi:glycosyltransferase involved in cell wall biosynthesis
MKLSVIIPVYNEEKTIQEIIKKVLEEPTEKEVLIVDDASSDNTPQILENFKNYKNIKIIHHKKNLGKGAAIRTALKYVTSDIILIQDADLEYDPKEYKNLIKPILEGKADVVYGSRFLGGPHRVLLFWHFVANILLTMFCNLLYNVNFTDIMTCYKVFRKEVLESINIENNRFGIEPELTAKIAKKNWRIYEVPISYYGRTYAEGKKIKLKDAFVVLFCLLKYKIFD